MLKPGMITIVINGSTLINSDLYLFIGTKINLHSYRAVTWQFYSIKMQQIIEIQDYNNINRFINIESLISS